MEHSSFLAGLILAVLLSQGKASLGGGGIVEKGPERDITTWSELHLKVLLNPSFESQGRAVKESGVGM